MEKWHGTSGGYNNHKCRCEPCRLAWNKYCREYRERKRRAFVAGVDDVHGTSSMYQKGCGCPMCKAGHARYSRQLYRGEKPREGSCEICQRQGKVVWDHDHASGDHRGWLCIQCNQALGLVKDDMEILSRMERYLSIS